ncbi:glycosyl hydrolase [Paraburkholderia sediminicola]|uniref:glycosyl hydrolase n=1 Tax=Paraburkholderia sediminicola TaxID=458836 RepID=UPI0038B6C8C1
MLKRSIAIAIVFCGIAISLTIATLVHLRETKWSDFILESALSADRHFHVPVVATPQIPCSSGRTGVFYGVVGHVQQGGIYTARSYQAQISQLRDLGMTIYAQDIGDKAAAEQVAQLARVAAAQCVGILPLIITPDVQANLNESTAYVQGHKLGVDSATALKGLVSYYQVGNEFDNDVIFNGASGDYPSHYDNAKYRKARGAIRGMIDGIKEVQPSARILLGSLSWLHYGFSDMLRDGTEPDGKRDSKKVVEWDITAWHWYSEMSPNRASWLPKPDILKHVLTHLSTQYQKPIWITEFGVRPDYSDGDPGAYLVGQDGLAGFVADAKKYGIQNVTLYQLYDQPDEKYGLIYGDGIKPKQRFEQVKNFIEAHPMP